MRNILFINPWICDFAAYDLWMRPVGLLRIAALLKAHGYNISYVDFLDRNHANLRGLIRRDDFGCGKFYKSLIPKPELIKDIPRPYFIYGLPRELAEEELRNIPKPNFIFISSGMTYWYPGVEYTAKLLKKYFPDVPIVLGGIYATLLPEHAGNLEGIDCIVSGGDLSSVCSQLSRILNKKIHPPQYYLYPEYGLLSDTSSLVMETSRGCSFNCSYCGSRQLNKSFVQRSPEEVMDEIEFYRNRYGVKNIAFYDDALLFDAEKHIIPILDEIIEKKIARGVNFHTPNGLHVRYINERLAKKLKAANFKTIVLSLETISPIRQKDTGGKVTTEEFKQAVGYLKRAGFKNKEIEVYLMLGMPHQKEEEVKEGIEFLHKLGNRITLVTYSLVPNTVDAKMLEEEGIIPADLDPLWHNDTIFMLREGNFSIEQIRKLRNYVGILNRKISD